MDAVFCSAAFPVVSFSGTAAIALTSAWVSSLITIFGFMGAELFQARWIQTLVRMLIGFAKIARRAEGLEIFDNGFPAFAPRNNVVDM